MTWWKHLNIDDGQDSMVDIEVVNIPSNDLFAYVMDIFVDCLMNDGYSNRNSVRTSYLFSSSIDLPGATFSMTSVS